MSVIGIAESIRSSALLLSQYLFSLFIIRKDLWKDLWMAPGPAPRLLWSIDHGQRAAPAIGGCKQGHGQEGQVVLASVALCHP